MSPFDGRRRWILDACLACALVVPACTKKTDDGTIPPVGGGDPVSTPAIELAPVDHASQLLPRDTVMLFMGSSVARAAEVLERERLLDEFRPQYEGIKSVMTGALGHDLLDPAAWAEVGLDSQGPLGIAFTDVVGGEIVLLGTISDRAKLVAWARGTAGKSGQELVEEAYGPASVLRPKNDDGPSIVMRDSLVALVFPSNNGDPTRELAGRMATMEPNLSLGGSVGYRKSTGGLRAADITVFMDIERMVSQSNSEAESRSSGPQSNWAQEDLERAQKEGASPERLAVLEQQAAEVSEAHARWRATEEAERALNELLVSGIEGVSFTVTDKRTGPILDGRIAAGEEAFVRRLLDNRSGAPVLPVAMNGAPLWCASGKVGVDALFELAEATAAIDGKSWSSVVAMAKTDLGLDLDADLRPALGGEAGLCLTLDGKLDPTADEPGKAIGLGAWVQVSDEAKAKYLLAKVASAHGVLGGRMKKRGGGYEVAVPKWRTLYADPVGDRIVLSSDPELAKRIAAGDPGSMPSKIVPASARGAMGLAGTAGTQAIDLSLMTMFFAVRRASFGEVEVEVAAPGFSAEEMKKVPLSAKSKKVRKALDKANAAVEKAEDERSAAELEQLMAISNPLGIGVVAAIEDDRGFTLTGGQFIRAESMGRVLEGLLRAASGGGPQTSPEQRQALEAAWEQQGEARSAYIEARLEDAGRFKAKKGR
ncbi:MAG: hypothetical protein H6712_05230 [Myxococcales bacterium]|nr:hypothetical protein [Myxococcales bacterium]